MRPGGAGEQGQGDQDEPERPRSLSHPPLAPVCLKSLVRHDPGPDAGNRNRLPVVLVAARVKAFNSARSPSERDTN